MISKAYFGVSVIIVMNKTLNLASVFVKHPNLVQLVRTIIVAYCKIHGDGGVKDSGTGTESEEIQLQRLI